MPHNSLTTPTPTKTKLMGKSSCCVKKLEQQPTTPEYTLDKSLEVTLKKNRNPFTFFNKKSQSKTHPSPLVIKKVTTATNNFITLKKSPCVGDFKGVFKQEEKALVTKEEEVPKVTRSDLDRMRRQFFGVEMEALEVPLMVVEKKSPKVPCRIPVPSKVTTTHKEVKNVVRKEGEWKSKIPVVSRSTVCSKEPPTIEAKPTTNIPVHSQVKKPIPSEPFYTKMLYKSPPPPISHLVTKEVVCWEKADSSEKFHSSNDEIYLIDDEISDQPDLTFRFCSFNNQYKSSSSLNSINSIVSIEEEEFGELEELDQFIIKGGGEGVGFRSPHRPPRRNDPSQNHYHHLHQEIASLKEDLLLLKTLLIAQEKRERAKDVLLQSFINNLNNKM